VRQPEVLRLLQHWQKAPVVSLAHARAEWIDINDSAFSAASFLQAVDRAAFCAYAISGDVLPAQSDSVGSITMFAVPAGLERSLTESIFDVIPLSHLLKHRANQPDLLAAARAYLREGTTQIHEWISTDRIVIEPRLGMVVVNSPTIEVIHTLQPYTMSWSNVLDYMTPRDFHTVARACSAAEETVHYAYSMNWTNQVKGSCLLDYADATARLRILDGSPKGMKDFLESKSGPDSIYPGVCQLIHLPPVVNAMNTADFVLASKSHPVWVKAFFDPARAGPHQLGPIAYPVYNFLARLYTTIAMPFSYDMNVRFQPMCQV
jgi:hypothetical protein